MIGWISEYQGYFIYPSLIIGMLWSWVTMPKKMIIRLPLRLVIRSNRSRDSGQGSDNIGNN